MEFKSYKKISKSKVLCMGDWLIRIFIGLLMLKSFFSTNKKIPLKESNLFDSIFTYYKSYRKKTDFLMHIL